MSVQTDREAKAGDAAGVARWGESAERRGGGEHRRARRVSSPRAVLAVAVLGCFMAFVDATIVNIAVPSIARTFHGSPLSSISWVLNAYNIVFAAFLVGGGQLADLLGRRKVFSLALIVFTGASACCAVAPSLGLLVAARAVQATGAAMLVPSSLAIVLEAHAVHERTRAVAMWSAVAALAAGIGPPLGGLLITASSWRLVFLVNVPIGATALVLAQRVLVESRAPGRRRMPDLLGGAVLAAAIAALVLGVVKGQEWGWTSARVIGALAAAVALGGYFVLRSSRHRAPIVDLSLLRIRGFSVSNAATVVMASGFYAYTLCNVLFLTTVWRYSVLSAGLALTPGPITAMAVARPASRLVGRFGHRAVIVPGAAIWAGGMLFMASKLGVHPDFLGGWLPAMVILGIGAGLSFPALSAAAVGSVPGPRFALATALSSVSRQVGAALGVATLIAILDAPGATGALAHFQHGWLFAAGCFLAGGVACLALVVVSARGETASLAAADHAVNGVAVGSFVEEASPATELPGLVEAEGIEAAAEPQGAAEFLRRIPIFASLSPELLGELAEIAEEVTLPRGDWLLREGDEADGVYVVRIGHLEVLQEERDAGSGREPGMQRINTLTRGAVLGELALLTDSRRSASVRALRDSELLRIPRASFDRLLVSEPKLALGLARALGAQLQRSRPVPVARRARPVTIALHALDAQVRLPEVADALSAALCSWGSVAVLLPEESGNGGAGGRSGEGLRDRSEAVARFAPLVERCEEGHDHVVMVGGPAGSQGAWEEFCLSRADRVVAVTAAAAHGAGEAGAGDVEVGDVGMADAGEGRLARLEGADLFALGVEPGSGALDRWIAALAPASVFAISTSAPRGDFARAARRLSGRATGLVLSGGGARAFAHLGALEVLLDAGVSIDRVGGVSMGAFVGGLLACGYDSATIDAVCYEEWVRRNPINDYTLPRSSLIRGRKAQAMLDRAFGEVRAEELSRPFYCASVNLRGNSLVIERQGRMADIVGASICLPLIAPPVWRDDALLIDGSLLDNLPLEPMGTSGEGAVLAIDVKGGEERPRRSGSHSPASDSPSRARSRRLPALPELMGRIALLSSANTDEAARRFADLTICIRVSGVGLLEFHQIDDARAAGRRAAAAALESAPSWLTSAGAEGGSGVGRRTVMRI